MLSRPALDRRADIMEFSSHLNRAIGLAVLVLCGWGSGCAHAPGADAGNDDRWQLTRDGWFRRVKEHGDVLAAVRMINFSESDRIRGDENRSHGEMLQQIKSSYPDVWEKAATKAKKSSRSSSEILIDAYLNGATFAEKPSIIVMKGNGGEQEDLGNGGEKRLSIDLSE